MLKKHSRLYLAVQQDKHDTKHLEPGLTPKLILSCIQSCVISTESLKGHKSQMHTNLTLGKFNHSAVETRAGVRNFNI